MAKTENFTPVLYEKLKHNTALWRYLNEDHGTVTIFDNEYWAFEKVSVYSDSMSDKACEQLYWIMENVYNKKHYCSIFHVPKDKYNKKQLMKGE